MVKMSKESPLVKAIVEKGLVRQKLMDIAIKEHEVTHEDFSMILIRNGFITQQKLTEAILAVDKELLSDDFVLLPNIPPRVLIETRTVILADTATKVYASTLSSELTVADRLSEYDTRPVEFMPMNVERMDSYLDEMASLDDEKNESMIDMLLRKAIRAGASDLHIIPREKSYTILWRRLGVREWMHEGDLDEYNIVVARTKDRANMDLMERRKPQDGSFFVMHQKRTIDMRVSTTPHIKGEYMVIRLLDPDTISGTLEGLGITNVEAWRQGVNRSHGLCLICGPTGSGKTTTLVSSIREIDRIEKAVFTIEDPVEYQTAFVGQVNVNEAVGLDFSRGQKAFMRQDPDIIITGEIRDEETARISIKGAETGHVMVATLHTGSIQGSIARMRDLGVSAGELRLILRTVLAQRLVRTICAECGGDGCATCYDVGYGGRTVVSECAYFEDEKAVDRLLNGEYRWPVMVADAVDKVEQGITTAEEVIRVFGPEGQEELERRQLAPAETDDAPELADV